MALVPIGVEIIVSNGYKVLDETNAGNGSGYKNKEYIAAGDEIEFLSPCSRSGLIRYLMNSELI